jgi:hypothetical protein
MIQFLKRVAERNAPLARALEISIISSGISAALSLLDAVNCYFLQGTPINYKFILSLFILSLSTGITGGLTKRLRDKKAKIDIESETVSE